ncbi:hypothetical protein MJL33_30600, partial [Salmonella enterica subsp. enterica serovar Kentucky]|nr:hypothetical protein [Salmonella enterica subsp. enterica serovar Kentucky]
IIAHQRLRDAPIPVNEDLSVFHRQLRRTADHVISAGSDDKRRRRLWEAVGVQVSRLIRVRYGDIPLPKGLPRGGWTELDLAQTN